MCEVLLILKQGSSVVNLFPPFLHLLCFVDCVCAAIKFWYFRDTNANHVELYRWDRSWCKKLRVCLHVSIRCTLSEALKIKTSTNRNGGARIAEVVLLANERARRIGVYLCLLWNTFDSSLRAQYRLAKYQDNQKRYRTSYVAIPTTVAVQGEYKDDAHHNDTEYKANKDLSHIPVLLLGAGF